MGMQPLGVNKIDNGMKSLIERHNGLRSRYIKGVKRILAEWAAEGRPVPNYERTTIYRVVYDITEINDDNKVIHEAFMALYKELYPAFQNATTELAIA